MIVYENDFETAPTPAINALYSGSYVNLTHITTNDQHFLRSGGPGTDWGVDSNHSPSLLNLLAIIPAATIGMDVLRGHKITFRLKFTEFYLPNPARIGLLVQSNDDRFNCGAGTVKNINSVQVKDMICTQLGVPRPRFRAAGTSGDRSLNNNDWVDVTIPFSDNPADWCYMPPASGHEDSYEMNSISTAVLDGGLINMMIVACIGTTLPTYEVGSIEGYAPSDLGYLDIDKITIETL